ncbi:P-loop containing nucleoside triphosphate hydrolase protein [Boletus edulis BED1]|uniref:P-loop containing nucleoside triphosphate hydrolase protein n=1 Tax=Boletus edulis BED1 TaxID=1328754 RepID=A0AAD4GBY7_BOLED|nr:P-loop containing nucleoside triphosphate hydrolase protein [Boletus edulis BED1]
MDRKKQITKRFLDILRGSTDVDRHKTHFLEGLSLQEDPAACVSNIVDSSHGLSAVQQAMRHDLSTKFMNGLGSSVIDYLLRANDLGDVLNTVLLHILDPPIFWNKFCDEFEKGNLDEHAESAFARLLVYLLRMENKHASRYRDRAKQLPILNRLIDSNYPEVEAAANLINEILSTASLTSAASTPEGPGGRHDNDFISFREISIVPTSAEIQCTKKAFFRHATLLDDPNAKETRIADYLDNTFRLLREDMLYELKDELQPILTKNSKKRGPRGTVIEGLSITGVFTGAEDQRTRTRHGIVLQCRGDFKIFHGVNDSDRKTFLKTHPRGSKFLSHQSLACLIADGQLLALGTILRVEDLLAKKPPSVVIQISAEASFVKTLLKLNAAKDVKLIQTNTAIFSFEPVLKVLQTMKIVPLAGEILFWETGIPICSPSATIPQITVSLARNPSMDIQPLLGTPTSIKLDSAQADSLLAGLNQRVALIQGPPGTGKSFIGALLAKALHDFTDQTILVVCYTNHALDQFLEDLLKIDIPDSSIVRLGGGANSTISHLSLKKQTKERYVRSNAEWTIIDTLKSRAEFLRKELDTKFSGFLASGISLEDMLTYVEFEDSEYFDAFQVPESTDGMIRVGKNGDAVGTTYLISQWSHGWDAGIFKQEPRILDAAAIWSMTHAQRQQKLADWKSAINRSVIDDVWKLARDFDECQDELSRKFNESEVALLKQKRVIGCTTTGAAKYTEDIKAASPGVLLVEEAGEILESHVITALGKDTAHMILIGDHKQLRPKVNNYELTVEKGEGYDLNRSLFERLVLKGFPHVTLTAQHRMRPEISALIRALTYPGLTDAPKTQNRADIRGIQSNVVFVDHSQYEDDEARISDRTDGGSQTSKRNQFEVDMVMKIVHYLVQQGYGSENIVLLTPYLGQLSALREALIKDADAIMNELDSRELARAGLMTSPTSHAKTQKTRIRLATIDNYQGEESDIIVASLTRSNAHGAIGFMNSPERLNVLISRARDGLILIGNSRTFKESKTGGELWTKFFGLLRNGSHIFQGFPVKCERHPTTTALIRSPAEFDTLAPDGGCAEPCGSLLSCNIHTCAKRCHPLRLGPGQPDAHKTMPCNHLFSVPCPANTHQLKWKCSQSRPETCASCEKEAKRLEKQARLDLEAQEQRDAAQRQHELDMTELESQLQFERDKVADIQSTKDRDKEKQQMRKDIEDAKKRLKNAAKQVGLQTSAAAAGTGNANSAPPQSTPSTSSPSQGGGNDASAHSQSSTSTPLRPSVPSPTRDEWERQKRVDGVQNDAIDKIMDLTGLEQVKEQILRIKAKIDTMKRQGVPLNKERLNLVLLGNPGTGKTTVARLYAQFLESIQVLPGDAFLETTGSKLSFEGVGGAQKLIDQALQVGGGAIFIDEAYQLTSDNSGKQVLDFLLAEMENRVGTLIFVLAGYNKEMEKFFEHNPGLPSRVPYRLQFADYTDAELMTMLEDLILKRYQGSMVIEDGIRGLYCRIAVRRLGRGRGVPGFGNARALQNMFAKVCECQAERVEKARRAGAPANDFYMTKEDLIGPDPSQVIPNNAAWAELQGLIGLDSVKQSVHNFFALVETNYHRELEEKEPLQMSLNRVFLGSPGTGKTSVSKLYGQVLADLGLLSNGEVVVKNPSDFVGAYLGHSEKNTKAILESTRGKVLVIDEAYMLYSGKSNGSQDSFKTTVIDTIVAEIQSVPGEDRCVLLLGYKEQMEEMFQNVNPGLARRFAIENAFNFEDFTEPQLMQILDYKLKKQDLAANDDAKQVARDLLSRMKDRPNFGNAGEVENLLGLAKDRYQKRMSSVPPHQRSDIVFEPQDFDPDFNRSQNASANLAKLFEDVIGCDEVVQKLDKYQRIAQTMKAQGLDMRKKIPSNFVFKGPPGTGKTTTARKLGQVYFDMGFLSSADVIECSASDLVGQYVGHTGPKTRKLFEKALGKVLFIDEAYRLGQGQFAQEAMDEIVDIMTKDKFMNKLVIIIAEYDDEMNKLLRVNPGLSSRFSEEIHFSNITPDQCLALLDKDLGTSNIVVAELANPGSPEYQQMRNIVYRMSILQSWGNARDMKTLGKRMFQQAYANASNGGQVMLSVAEVIDIMQSMLKEQRDRVGVPSTRAVNSPPPPVASLSGPPPPPPPTASSSSSQSSKPPPPPPPPPSNTSKPPSQRQPSQADHGHLLRKYLQRSNGPGLRSNRNAENRRPQSSRIQSTPLSRPHQTCHLPLRLQLHNPRTAPAQTATSTSQVKRDSGVSDEIWNQLQADKRAAEEQKQRTKEEESRLRREMNKAYDAERQAERTRMRAEALERAKREAAADRAMQERLQRELEIARRREAEVKAARERAVEELRRKRQEEARRAQSEQEIRRKLQRSGRCPMGYRWVKQVGGWRCEGGSHFVSDGQLRHI